MVSSAAAEPQLSMVAGGMASKVKAAASTSLSKHHDTAPNQTQRSKGSDLSSPKKQVKLSRSAIAALWVACAVTARCHALRSGRGDLKYVEEPAG
jgi:hypothetical protein